jgi:hypothetical protein
MTSNREKTNMTEEIDAPHGDKMIEITIRFWTNDIAEEEGKVLPKHIHNSGMVRLTANKTRRTADAIYVNGRIAGQDRRTIRAP